MFKRKSNAKIRTEVITRYVEVKPSAKEYLHADAVVEQLVLIYAKAQRADNELYAKRAAYDLGSSEYRSLSSQMWLCGQQMEAAIDAIIELTGMYRAEATFQIPKRARQLLAAGKVAPVLGFTQVSELAF